MECKEYRGAMIIIQEIQQQRGEESVRNIIIAIYGWPAAPGVRTVSVQVASVMYVRVHLLVLHLKVLLLSISTYDRLKNLICRVAVCVVCAWGLRCVSF
jgi:hypothetical protein